MGARGQDRSRRQPAWAPLVLLTALALVLAVVPAGAVTGPGDGSGEVQQDLLSPEGVEHDPPAALDVLTTAWRQLLDAVLQPLLRLLGELAVALAVALLGVRTLAATVPIGSHTQRLRVRWLLLEERGGGWRVLPPVILAVAVTCLLWSLRRLPVPPTDTPAVRFHLWTALVLLLGVHLLVALAVVRDPQIEVTELTAASGMDGGGVSARLRVAIAEAAAKRPDGLRLVDGLDNEALTGSGVEELAPNPVLRAALALVRPLLPRERYRVAGHLRVGEDGRFELTVRHNRSLLGSLSADHWHRPLLAEELRTPAPAADQAPSAHASGDDATAQAWFQASLDAAAAWVLAVVTCHHFGSERLQRVAWGASDPVSVALQVAAGRLVDTGLVADGIRLHDRALELDPDNGGAILGRAMADMFRSMSTGNLDRLRYDEAVAQLRRLATRSTDRPRPIQLRAAYALAAAELNRHLLCLPDGSTAATADLDDAERTVRQLEADLAALCAEGDPGVPQPVRAFAQMMAPSTQLLLAGILLTRGACEGEMPVAQQPPAPAPGGATREIAPSSTRGRQLLWALLQNPRLDHRDAYTVACCFVTLEDHDRALLYLERALRHSPALRSWARVDPSLRPLWAAAQRSHLERLLGHQATTRVVDVTVLETSGSGPGAAPTAPVA